MEVVSVRKQPRVKTIVAKKFERYVSVQCSVAHRIQLVCACEFRCRSCMFADPYERVFVCAYMPVYLCLCRFRVSLCFRSFYVFCMAMLRDCNWLFLLNRIRSQLTCTCDLQAGVPAGLVNLGATCYVNSLLQIWFHNTTLREAVYRWRPKGLLRGIVWMYFIFLLGIVFNVVRVPHNHCDYFVITFWAM